MSEDEALPPDAILAAGDDRPTFALDVPAFVRRGTDVESALVALRERCLRNRLGLLETVHMRLRQWARLAVGPGDWRDAFATSPAPLWDAAAAPPPSWARSSGARRTRRAAARDLKASVERFNARWADFLDRLDLRLVNDAIDGYNEYYVIEKECVMGSARLAASGFAPVPRVEAATLAVAFPPLPVPDVAP